MYIFPYIYIYILLFSWDSTCCSMRCLCLRVENRPSVLGIFFICSLGWGGVITFTYLRTPMMLRHGTFTCTCTHTSCYVEDVSRHAGVGWGGVITFTYLRTIDSCWRMIKASVPDQLTSCPENEQKLNDLIWTYVRTCQWRWEANVVGKTLLEKTGAYLAKM